MTFYEDVVAWNLLTERDKQAPQDLRIACVREEYSELMSALLTDDRVSVAQECADLIWTVCGLAYGLGIPLNRVWAEVRRSNGEKILPDGSVIRRQDGKIMKPEGWTPPDIEKALSTDTLLTTYGR